MADEILYGINIHGERVPLSEADLAQRAIDAAASNKPVDLKAYAQAARYTHENGGITVAGIPIATDDRSKTMILGALQRSNADPSLVVSWAALDGHIYPLTAAHIVAISNAVFTFVSNVFDAYGHIIADITAGTITTTDEIDTRYDALEVAFLPVTTPAPEPTPDQDGETAPVEIAPAETGA